MGRHWLSNRLLPDMTTFFSNSFGQRGVLAPLYPVATTRQTQAIRLDNRLRERRRDQTSGQQPSFQS
ncbi:unnamed protein product [Merluccius merluccius]